MLITTFVVCSLIPLTLRRAPVSFTPRPARFSGSEISSRCASSVTESAHRSRPWASNRGMLTGSAASTSYSRVALSETVVPAAVMPSPFESRTFSIPCWTSVLPS